MATRTAKFMGTAYATSGNVTVEVDYNGTRVYTGPVSTIVQSTIPLVQPNMVNDWMQPLFEFETNTDTTGQIPIVITVAGGTLFWAHIWMNYAGPLSVREQCYPDIPIDPNDPHTFDWIVSVPTAEYFTDPNFNTVESDGISNTAINGLPVADRVNVTEEIAGDWCYPITNEETFTCELFVDPTKVILVDPA
jgi:hypothetical protein